MAKISALPLVAAPSGRETVVVLAAGVAKRVDLSPLAGAALAPHVTDANTAIERKLAESADTIDGKVATASGTIDNKVLTATGAIDAKASAATTTIGDTARDAVTTIDTKAGAATTTIGNTARDAATAIDAKVTTATSAIDTKAGAATTTIGNTARDAATAIDAKVTTATTFIDGKAVAVANAETRVLDARDTFTRVRDEAVAARDVAVAASVSPVQANRIVDGSGKVMMTDRERLSLGEMVAAQTIGERAVVAATTTAAAQTFIFEQAAPQTGRITAIRIGLAPSATARTLKLRRYLKAGNIFTPVADSEIAVPVVAGYQSILVNIPVKAGEYVGAYTGAEGLSYSQQQTGAAVYWHAAGEVTSATEFVRVSGGDVRVQLGFDMSYVVAGDDRLQAIEQRAATANDRAVVVEGVADSAYGIADGVSAAMRLTQTIGRPAAEGVVATGPTAVDTVWVLAQPVEGAGYIRTARFALSLASPAAGSPISIQRWSRVGNSFTRVSQKTVTGYPGINSLPIGLKIAKDDYVGIYAGGQRLSYTTGSGIPYFNAASGAGNVASFDDAADSGTTVRLECSFDIDYFPVTAATAAALDAVAVKAQVATAAIGDIGAPSPVPIYTRGANTSGSWVAGTNFKRWRVGVLGSSLPAGKRVTQWTVTAQLPAEVATVHAMLYARPIDANVGAASMAADVTVWAAEAVIPRAALAAGTGFVDVTFADPAPFVPDPAKAYALRFYARDASGVETYIGCRQAAGGTEQFERGYYNNTATDASWSVIGGALSTALRVDTTAYQVRKEALPADVGSAVLPDLLMTPVVTLTTPSALSVTVAGTARKNGAASTVSGTIVFPAAASGKDRIDLIVMDRLSLALSRVAGTERPALTDSVEYIPAVPAGSVLIARVQVSETKAIAVNCSLFRGLVKVGGEAEMEAHVRRNMSLTRRTRGKAMRGAASKLGGYGDSITAQQGGGIPGFEANGNSRDRIGYLGVYPADTRARVPQYDFGRGVTDNTKIGWNWRIKEALDAVAGAEVVTYLNYAIGGTNSGATDPGDGRVNGLHPGRLAVPLAAGLDLVTIAFGMNERGSAATYGNLVDMTRQFLAVGTEVALIGCPRPGTSYAGTSSTTWRYTCDAIEAAAMDAGAAYISTAAIADDRNLGAIGLPAEALGATNITVAANHPGILELLQYGRGCVQQLGL